MNRCYFEVSIRLIEYKNVYVKKKRKRNNRNRSRKIKDYNRLSYTRREIEKKQRDDVKLLNNVLILKRKKNVYEQRNRQKQYTCTYKKRQKNNNVNRRLFRGRNNIQNRLC